MMRIRKSNLGLIGGRQVLSPLQQPCFPKVESTLALVHEIELVSHMLDRHDNYHTYSTSCYSIVLLHGWKNISLSYWALVIHYKKNGTTIILFPSENQQFLKDILRSVMKGDGVSWFVTKRLRKLMCDESLRVMVANRLYGAPSADKNSDAVDDMVSWNNTQSMLVKRKI